MGGYESNNFSAGADGCTGSTRSSGVYVQPSLWPSLCAVRSPQHKGHLAGWAQLALNKQVGLNAGVASELLLDTTPQIQMLFSWDMLEFRSKAQWYQVDSGSFSYTQEICWYWGMWSQVCLVLICSEQRGLTYNWPHFQQEVGLDEFLRSLPAWNTLWFCATGVWGIKITYEFQLNSVNNSAWRMDKHFSVYVNTRF